MFGQLVSCQIELIIFGGLSIRNSKNKLNIYLIELFCQKNCPNFHWKTFKISLKPNFNTIKFIFAFFLYISNCILHANTKLNPQGCCQSGIWISMCAMRNLHIMHLIIEYINNNNYVNICDIHGVNSINNNKKKNDFVQIYANGKTPRTKQAQPTL